MLLSSRFILAFSGLMTLVVFFLLFEQIADDLKTLEFLRKEDCPFYVGALFNESLERGQISVAEWIYSTANSDEHVLPKLRYLASKRAANASVAWVGGSPLDAIRMLASFCLDHVDSVEFLRAAAETVRGLK